VALVWWKERAEQVEPVAAWVAIETAEAGVAAIGPVTLAAADPVRLFAVLEGRARDGEAVYWTEAPRLVRDGSPVPAQSVRRYDGNREARLLWFSVEPALPFLELETVAELQRFSFQEVFHPEWGRSWTANADLRAHFENRIAGPETARGFGTQRFAAWVELFGESNKTVPEERFKSPGADRLLEEAVRFPTLVALLPGAAGPASRVFGLPQLETSPTAEASVPERLRDMAQRQLAFSRLLVLGSVLQEAGLDPERLPWSRIDLGARLPWDERVKSGDLVRVGARMVVLYRDAGEESVLDAGDLCFDFEQGATVRALGEVFVGEGNVEWAALGG
jgi:hypothetical protein